MLYGWWTFSESVPTDLLCNCIVNKGIAKYTKLYCYRSHINELL